MGDAFRQIFPLLKNSANDIIIVVSVTSRYLIARKLNRGAKGPKQVPFCDSDNPELTDFVGARPRSMNERG